MPKCTLLTGATGLVGQYLVRDLLLDDQRLCLVVRGNKTGTAYARVDATLQMWERQLGKLLPRPVVFEGDVTQPALGLDEEQRQWVAEHCDRVLHNAAILTFYGSDRQGEPWQTNVQGTANVLDLCREAGIGHLHYVSTAYVCGCRQGVIKEDDLDDKYGFRNDYEHSKLEAERLVRSADFLDQLTIYRPAVIAGDSCTGYTNTYHGIYAYLKLMSILVWNTEPGPDGVRYTPVRLNMTGDEPRNIIPVDWVSAVICHLFNKPAAHGRTYHLAPDDPVTTKQIINAGYKYFNSRGVEFAGPAKQDDGPISEMDEAAHANKTVYESYETSDPVFDTTNLKQFASNLPCPKLDEAMIHRFWRYGEQDRWGKRRPQKPEIPFDVQGYLQALVARHSQHSNGGAARHAPTQIGLDVCGPGGGQWQLTLQGPFLTRLQPGIPDNGTLVLQLPADVFAEFSQSDRLPVEHLPDYCVDDVTPDQGQMLESVARALFSKSEVSQDALAAH